LNPQLEEALNSMKAGDVSNIIRTPLGYHVVRLDNIRTTKPIPTEPVTELHALWVAIPITADMKVDDAQTQLRAVVAKNNKAYQAKALLNDAAFIEKWSASKDYGWVNPNDIQPTLQQAIRNTAVGSWSAPIQTTDSLGALFVLESRKTIPTELTAYRDRVHQHLADNRTELASRQLMQSLRQRAFVDVRW
jgi:peptidyl-prolyl cis-trans isomerase SurA